MDGCKKYETKFDFRNFQLKESFWVNKQSFSLQSLVSESFVFLVLVLMNANLLAYIYSKVSQKKIC